MDQLSACHGARRQVRSWMRTKKTTARGNACAWSTPLVVSIRTSRFRQCLLPHMPSSPRIASHSPMASIMLLQYQALFTGRLGGHTPFPPRSWGSAFEKLPTPWWGCPCLPEPPPALRTSCLSGGKWCVWQSSSVKRHVSPHACTLVVNADRIVHFNYVEWMGL